MEVDYYSFLLPNNYDVSNKKVLLRADFNVPTKNGKVLEDTRIMECIPFILNLHKRGAKTIIVSHIEDDEKSLLPVYNFLKSKLPKLMFANTNNIEELRLWCEKLNKGEILMVENIRNFEGEKEDSPELAKSFASLVDMFVNDAFSVSHRKHALVHAITNETTSFLGPTMYHELISLSPALNPSSPSLLVLGGAKISTKMPLIKTYLNKGVNVFVGGALAHNIWKSKGIEIGKSLYDEGFFLDPSISDHPLLFTPEDVVLDDGSTVNINSIPSERKVVDIGQVSLNHLKKLANSSNTVIFNGPLGYFEGGWKKGTEDFYHFLKKSDNTYLGGGDTLLALHQSGLRREDFTHVSLGGGAMLDYLGGGELPGLLFVTKHD